MDDFNFTPKKPIKCIHCKKYKGMHKAITLQCPDGMKTQIGYLSYHPTNKFTPKVK